MKDMYEPSVAASIPARRGCLSCQLARKSKNVFYQTNPNLLDRTKITNPAGAKAYEPKPPFSLSRKLTRKKTFFTKRTQIFLVDKDHKSFLWKGLRSQACILPIKKTNPNEPKLTEKEAFFTKPTQMFLIPKIANPVSTKAYDNEVAFSSSRKRTQTNPNSPILFSLRFHRRF
ncbi:MAG: hypothetical protein ACYTEX_21600 [Planctomycetota bacterium]|jgi:hypothetical protein